MEKPVGRWFVQMESKIPISEISVWGGVYHLNNRPNLPKEPEGDFDILKMAAEIVVFNEIIGASIGHVRYINIQAWLRGFRVKIANF